MKGTEMFVTLKALREANACFDGYNRVVRALQGGEFTQEDKGRESYIHFTHTKPISIEAILASNDLDDALWALRCVKGRDRDLRLFAVWCARQVEHLLDDPRSKDALAVAERFANGLTTQEELLAAWGAAWEAARNTAKNTAREAAREAAGGAAREAAGEAAWEAACNAARAASCNAAWDEGWDSAWGAGWDSAWGAQRAMLIKVCRGEAPWQSALALDKTIEVELFSLWLSPRKENKSK